MNKIAPNTPEVKGDVISCSRRYWFANAIVAPNKATMAR